jgi:serine/threonine-protein phosphatase 2A regulatory subunit A
MEHIQLMGDSLGHSDPLVRIEDIKKLTMVATKVGPELTVRELMPLLMMHLDTDDEILLSVAKQLGGFAPLVSGNVSALLQTLESLCGVEETIVREQAVQSIVQIMGSMSKDSVVRDIAPMVERLVVSGEWMSRRSACGLIAEAHRLVGGRAADTRAHLIESFQKLIADETPMVRRGAALCIGNVADSDMTSTAIADSLFPCLKSLVTGGDVDSVRVKAVKSCGPLIANMDARTCEETIVPLFQTLVTDRSWTIRHACVVHFGTLARVVGANTTRTVLVRVVCSLLDDPEGEVRKACINQVDALLHEMGPSASKSKEGAALLEALSSLAEDEYTAVRMAVMECAMKLLRAGNEEIHDLVMSFAESEEDETKLPVLADLTEIARNMPRSEVGLKLFPIIEMILVGWTAGGREPMSQQIGGSSTYSPQCVIYPQDAGTSWRQRQQVISNFPGVGQHIGRDKFTELLLPLLFATLYDPISAVRLEVVHTLASLTTEFSAGWMLENVCPHLVSSLDDTRGSTVKAAALLQAIGSILEASEPGSDATSAALAFLPGVMKITPVSMNPTIAIAALPTLGALARHLGPSDVSSRILPILEALCKDEEKLVSERANMLMETM